MRTIYSLCLSAFLLFSANNRIFSQVAVSNSGDPPDGSAMLDIQSTGNGLLVPRINFNNRPPNPATGLILYVSDHGPFGNGLYVYDGDSWRLVGTSTYYFGQHTAGGTVFYVDPTGRHGLVAAPIDQGWFYWGCDTILIGPDAQHYEIMTGDLNTNAIIAGCTEENIAAKACKSLTLGGYSDWFLPSIDELDSMLVHRDTIGGFDPDWYYYSSTEVDSVSVLSKYNNPDWIPYNIEVTKNYNIKVRCVRKL